MLRSHRWRTAENSAAYLLPHLSSGISLLDAGCGPGTITADLATPSGNDDVVTALVSDGRPVSAAVLNAGVGVHGRFDRADLADHLRVVGVNVVSPVRLAHHLLSGMVARGEGRLMVTSSIAADGPGPFQSTYAASKAFLSSFAQALRYEMRGTGVTVTSPGSGSGRSLVTAKPAARQAANPPSRTRTSGWPQ